MRNYSVMRDVLSLVASAPHELSFDDFDEIQQQDEVPQEIVRLQANGLVDGDIRFGAHALCLGGRVKALTDEGTEFYKLIENDDVWALIRDTLKRASVDVSYPLLKEVCEEIVKRYVTSFIPKI